MNSDVLNSQQVNTVVIATRHHLHANQVLAALAARKNVFCEKPLCLNEEELAKIVRAHSASSHEQNPLPDGWLQSPIRSDGFADEGISGNP